MAPRKDSERLNQALQSLREARGELSSEAHWLREKLSPAQVVHRTLDRHGPSILCGAFATGLLAARLIVHKKEIPSGNEIVPDSPRSSSGRGQGSLPRLGATLAQAAVPFLLKFVTSKPVISKMFQGATSRRASSV